MCLPLDTIEFAHDLPLQCLEYCTKSDELASCAGEPGFKLWNAHKRRRLTSVSSTVGDIIIVKWCNMDEGFWLTAADEGTIALWDPVSLIPIRTICYRKEPVTALLVDETNMILLVSMQSDYAIRAYKLDLTGEELCAYTGHTEQVHALAYLSNRNQYLSGSWDNSIRIWLAPSETTGNSNKRMTYCLSMNDDISTKPKETEVFAQEVKYVSAYETEHPLVVPKQLQEMVANIPSSQKPLHEVNAGSGAPQSSARRKTGAQTELIKQPPLVFKLAELEKSLNDRIT